MDVNDSFDYESLMFKYIEKFKFLLFPNTWTNNFMEYSKNEILAIMIIYKNKSVNMSEVADYINAPLNTATGVITRLEKKQIVERKRDTEDKRVVKISLTEKGLIEVKDLISHISSFIKKIYKVLEPEEVSALISITNKALSILKDDNMQKQLPKKEKIRKITIE